MTPPHPLRSALLLALAGVACNGRVRDVEDIPDGAVTGPLVVDLATTGVSSLPADVEEVWVRFEDVRVDHEEKGWISLSDERQDVELVARAGDPVHIGHGAVYEGAYRTVRLVVADAWVVVAGSELDLTVTEDLDGVAQPGFDSDEAFFVGEDATTRVTVIWDLGDQLDLQDGSWTLASGGMVDVELEGE